MSFYSFFFVSSYIHIEFPFSMLSSHCARLFIYLPAVYLELKVFLVIFDLTVTVFGSSNVTRKCVCPRVCSFASLAARMKWPRWYNNSCRLLWMCSVFNLCVRACMTLIAFWCHGIQMNIHLSIPLWNEWTGIKNGISLILREKGKEIEKLKKCCMKRGEHQISSSFCLS